MRVAASKERQFTGWHMLAITVSFFAVVICVNGVMAWLANSTWSGLVVENGYVASQSFNADEAAAKAQEGLGWKVELSHRAGSLTIAYAGSGAKPIRGLTITGQLRRTVTASEDKTLTFREEAPGSYKTEAALAPGLWEVEVTAVGNGPDYHKIFRFMVK